MVLYALMAPLAGAEAACALGSVIQSESAKPGPTGDQVGVGLAKLASGTVPFVFEGNRIYADVVFVRPDGTLHKSLAFVDLGSPSTILSPAFFEESRLDQKKPLALRIGEMAVSVDSNTVMSDPWLPYGIGGHRQVEACCLLASCGSIKWRSTTHDAP